MSTSLRATALAALSERADARAAEEAARQEAVVAAAFGRVRRSPLGEWFPEVEWEFVANCTDGTTIVREADGARVMLGVHNTNEEPDAWEVAIYRTSLASLLGPTQYQEVEVVTEAADIGAYIQRTDPRNQGDV